MSKMRCDICPHRCALEEGQVGLCRARSNRGGVIVSENYGLVTSISLDPIEKKPLYRFYPGSYILSVGSFGCNFHCQFCQNHRISMTGKEQADCWYLPPDELVDKALMLVDRGNIGLAFTYNEPLVGYEYVYDCAFLAREKNLKNVLVTNGYINEGPLLRLLPLIDAMNIDLKSFKPGFYQRIGGNLEDVKRTIILCAAHCHVEVTTLIIPGENDSEEEMRELAGWLASVDPDIPLHISRFFPCYQMTDKRPTSPRKVYALADIAKKILHYVYVGNI